jgi:glutaredoxin 3
METFWRVSMGKPIELYTAPGCTYSDAAREDLEWRGVDFVEFTGGNRTVPVISEEGKPPQIGWMGQGCYV